MVWRRISAVLGVLSVLFCASALRAQTMPEYAVESAPEPAKPAADKPAAVKPAPKVAIPKPAPVPAAKVEAKAEAKPAPEPKTTGSIPRAAPDALADIAPADRAAVRAALLWSGGEETKPAPGEDAISAAIKAYQKRGKGKVTGTLTAIERDELIAAGKAHQEEYGWTIVVDPATGIRLGLPAKLVSQTHEATNGTRWSSKHGDVQIETFRIKSSENLGAIFERMKREPDKRKVETSNLRADGFVISGLQGLKKFGVRAQLKDGELRGYTMLFDQAMEGIVAPVQSAMASAFAPFPAGLMPIAALSKPVEYGSGLIVSANGHILTDRRLAENCAVIAASGLGNAERVALDNEHGLALIRVWGKRDLAPASLSADAAGASELTLIGVPDPHTQEGGGKLAEIKAQLIDGNAIRLREAIPVAGFSGAAALDRQGRVLGLMQTRNIVLASAEGAVPPVRLIPASTIRAFLAAHDIEPARPGADPRAAVVRVMCVRK